MGLFEALIVSKSKGDPPMTDTTESKSASNGGQYLFSAPELLPICWNAPWRRPATRWLPLATKHTRGDGPEFRRGRACRDLHPGWPRPTRCGVSQRHGDFHIRASFRRVAAAQADASARPTLALPSSPRIRPRTPRDRCPAKPR